MTDTTQARQKFGQDPHIVPFRFEFDTNAIVGFLHPDLPDVVFAENAHTLQQMEFIEAATGKRADDHLRIAGTGFQFKYPAQVPA